ncbi:MAG TPA: hypothetical protein IAB63_08680 [Candidatus Onthocola gallistercoris]|uniref:DRTGG domain-containing protein n=1 Tax=Candidatus Onthocola gallistercoris TaxID=2840876 RepID=A0A9D1HJH1_9FIRM|nr:hypothetical protein [Candidatus Onthocola gallistercoris]
MTLKQLIDKNIFTLLNTGDDTERQITTPFCCDLLSIAMGRAPAGCAWVTVMANMNTLAVASLADAACIILAEDVHLDEAALNKAKIQGITVFETDMPVFEAACKVLGLMEQADPAE